jgi:glycosyltransferase involved in cell wall biosynthesis
MVTKNMQKEPKISTIVCNYNYAKYISETLTSIVEQEYKNLEIIVIDDGSTDNSIEIIEQFIETHSELNIRLHSGENQGVCYARNKGLELAKGEYFLFVDSDDKIPSNFIAALHKTAVESEVDVVYADYDCWDGEKITSEQSFPEFDIEKLKLYNYIDICALVKTSAIGDNRFDLKLNRLSHEDYDFWLGLALKGLKFKKCNDTRLLYRVGHQGRNRNIDDYRDTKLAQTNVHMRIIDKYADEYPEKIVEGIKKELLFQLEDVLNNFVGLQFVNSDLQNEIRSLQSKNLDLENSVTNLNAEILQIRNSKRYKLGESIASFLRIPIRIKRKLRIRTHVKNLFQNTKSSINNSLFIKKIRVKYFKRSIKLWQYKEPDHINFGDELTAYIIERLFKKNFELTELHLADMVGVGSILDIFYGRNEKMYIWGSGFIMNGDNLNNENLIFKAVRGKNTKDRIGAKYRNIPIGDPGLLSNLIFEPSKCEDKIGVIPHYLDMDSEALDEVKGNSDKYILISPKQSPEVVISDITKCKVILSSSLHGLICADSFGIPNIHMPLSTKLKGGEYKFQDYYSAINKEYKNFNKENLNKKEAIDKVIKEYKEIENLKEIQKNLIKAFPLK